MRKLLFLLLLIPSLASAQSVRYQNIALSSRGLPLANQNVAICTQPASTGTQPCSPLATLGTSTSTTSGGTNPTTTDANGNFFFYAPPGTYTIQIYGPQVSTPFVMPDVSISSAGVAVSVSSGGNVQNAINALPVGTPGGGTVLISPGSYNCPTSIPSGVTLVNSYGWWAPTVPPQIWSKFNGAAFNSFSSGPGSQNMVKFTGCTLNPTDVSQIGILGIVLDYGGTANMTMTGVSWSQFAMAVVNTATTAPALTLIGDSSFGTSNNSFPWLFLEGGNGGLSIGTASAVKFSTVNTFGWVYLLADAQPTGTYTGVKFVANCDSTQFKRVSVYTTNVITNFTGVIFNSSSATAVADVSAEIIEMYEETMNGAPATSTSFVINPSVANIFTTGALQSLAQTSVTSWSGTSQYTWNETGYLAGTANLQLANVFQGNTLLFQGNTFANIGTGPQNNGVVKFCSDCTIANPCAGAGTGAIAKRLNGVWVCN